MYDDFFILAGLLLRLFLNSKSYNYILDRLNEFHIQKWAKYVGFSL